MWKPSLKTLHSLSLLLGAILISGCGALTTSVTTDDGRKVIEPRIYPGNEKEIGEYCAYFVSRYKLHPENAKDSINECRSNRRTEINNQRNQCRPLVQDMVRASGGSRKFNDEMELCIRNTYSFPESMKKLKQFDRFRVAEKPETIEDFIREYKGSDMLKLVPDAKSRLSKFCGPGPTETEPVEIQEKWLSRFELVGPEFCGEQLARTTSRLTEAKLTQQSALIGELSNLKAADEFLQKNGSKLLPQMLLLAQGRRTEFRDARNFNEYQNIKTLQDASLYLGMYSNDMSDDMRQTATAKRDQLRNRVLAEGSFDEVFELSKTGDPQAVKRAFDLATTEDQKRMVQVKPANESAPANKAEVKDNKGNLALSQKCTNALVNSVNPMPNESHDFYGECDQGGNARSGIVVQNLNTVPTDIRCLKNGVYQETIGEFEACSAYWASLPNYCAIGDYRGQCSNGLPNGVGFRYRITYQRVEVQGVLSIFSGMARPQEAHETFRGMFKDGELDGHGSYFSISGCGMVGCSGSRIKQKGWFERGTHKFECSNAHECSKKVSGSAFTTRLRAKAVELNAQNASAPQAQASFESHIRNFSESGKAADLKMAQSMAKTKPQQAVLEFNILRVAGFEKGLSLSARLSNGNNSVAVNDSQRLLGFFRSVDSSVPVRIVWSINSVGSVAPLKHGSYSVQVRVGVKVKSTNRTCIGTICNTRDDVKTHAQTFEAALSPKNAYKAQGTYDFAVSGAATAMVLGTQSLTDITALEPIISIETVELSQ